jgi:hypothetical protein
MVRTWKVLLLVIIAGLVLMSCIGGVPNIVNHLHQIIEDLQIRVCVAEELLFTQVEYTIYLQDVLDERGIHYMWYSDFEHNYLYPNGETLYDRVEERLYYEFGR